MKKIKVFQIQKGSKLEDLMFRDYEAFDKAGYGKIPMEAYTEVFCGEIFADCPDDVYQTFQDHGMGFRSMSVSDIVEMDGNLYFCDDVGFRAVLAADDTTVEQEDEPAEEEPQIIENHKTRRFHVGTIVRHYNGRIYRIEGFGNETETKEPVVVYRYMSSPYYLRVRSEKSFCEKLNLDGWSGYRFEKVNRSR